MADTAQKRLTTVATAASVISSIAAVIAVFVSLYVGTQANDAAVDRDVRADRAEAYAAFIDSHVRFNEFMWANLYWAGTDSEEPTPAAYWEDAAVLQAELESRFTVARILSDGGDIEDSLTALRVGQFEVYEDFKCMSSLPCTKDPAVLPTTNGEINLRLDAWLDSAQEDMKRLADAASLQLR